MAGLNSFSKMPLGPAGSLIGVGDKPKPMDWLTGGAPGTPNTLLPGIPKPKPAKPTIAAPAMDTQDITSTPASYG
jgi:hypothetical protein